MLAFVCSPEGGEDRGYWRKASSFILFHVFSSFQALLAPVRSGTPTDGAEGRLSILFPIGVIDENRTRICGFCYSSPGDRLYASQVRSEALDCIISIPPPISWLTKSRTVGGGVLRSQLAPKSPFMDCGDPSCHDKQEMFRMATEAVSSTTHILGFTGREGREATRCIHEEGERVYRPRRKGQSPRVPSHARTAGTPFLDSCFREPSN